MVSNVTLLVGETGVSGENHRPFASHWQKTVSHNVVSSTPRLSGVRIHKVSLKKKIKTSDYCKTNIMIIPCGGP